MKVLMVNAVGQKCDLEDTEIASVSVVIFGAGGVGLNAISGPSLGQRAPQLSGRQS